MIKPATSHEALYENYSVINEAHVGDKRTGEANDSHTSHSPSMDRRIATLDQAIIDIKVASK